MIGTRLASATKIPEKSDERSFYASGEETIESKFARTGWTIPNTPQEDAFEAWQREWLLKAEAERVEP